MQENQHINHSPSYYSILTAEVRYSDKLTDFEKVLFSDITALTNKQGYCNATNKYFANVFNKSIRSITRSISKLIENQFLKCDLIYDENHQIIERRLSVACHSVSIPMDKNGERGIDKNGVRGIDKNVYYNNINNINNIKRNKERGGTSSQHAPTAPLKFKKPLLKDIQEYMQAYAEQKGKTIKSGEEAEMFFNYYEGNGWKVGKNNMKDWMATVRTWVIRSSSDYKKGNEFISEYL